MPDLDYVKLVGRLGLVVGDGVADPDVLPDTIWCSEGEVRITPLNVYTKVAEGVPSPWTAGQASVSATVNADGYVTWNGQPYVWLVDLTSSKVNPVIPDGQATHRIEIVNVRAAGTQVKFPSANIRIAADSVDPELEAVDLTLAMPVPAAGGTPITVGLRGTGLTGSIVQVDPTAFKFVLTSGEETEEIELPPGAPGTEPLVSVATKSDLDEVAPEIRNARALDVQIDYTRDIPGSELERKDGALVVPASWNGGAANPTLLPTKLNELLAARRAYAQSRTSLPATLSETGLPARNQGIQTTLFFTDDQEWHFAPIANAFTDTGFTFKRPAVRLWPGTTILGEGATRFVWHGQAPFSPLFATPYRPFDETPIRSDNTALTSFGSSTAEARLYKSNGTGQVVSPANGGLWNVGGVTWRYRNAARSVITSNVAAGDTTLTVDFVDGIDRAWFTANAPTAPLPTPISVGDWVMWSQGQNPEDGHEWLYFDYAQVVAINGTTTLGYTAQGAGTITLSSGASRAFTMADQFWNYGAHTGSGSGHYMSQASGGVDNIDAHAIFRIDQTYWCHRPKVKGVEFVTADGTNRSSNAFVMFNSCVEPLIEDVRVFNAALQMVDFNRSLRPRARNISGMGNVRSANNNPSSIGMLFDAASSRGLVIDGMHMEGYTGLVAQLETASDAVIKNLSVVNNSPAYRANSPQPQQAGKDYPAVFAVIGESKLRVENATFEGYGSTLVGRGGATTLESDVVFDGDIRFRSTHAASPWRFSLSEFAASARIRYEGFKADGVTPTEYRLENASWHTVSMRYAPGQNGVTAPIPVGGLRQVRVTYPSTVAAMTDLRLRTGIGQDITLNPLGTVTNVTGTEGSTTITSTGSSFPATAADGDLIVIEYGGDIGTVTTSILTASASTITVADPLPADVVAGTPVQVGNAQPPNTTLQVAERATRMWLPGKSVDFARGKLDAEAAGGRAVIKADFDPSADSTQFVRFDFETFEVPRAVGDSLPVRPFTPTATGDRQGNPVLASILAQLAADGILVDTTTDSGLVLSQHRQTCATIGRADTTAGVVNLVDGTVYLATFTPEKDTTITGINFLVRTAFAGVSIARAQVGTYNDATDTFTPLAESANQSSTLSGLAANAVASFPLANTGRLASSPTSITLKRGTRYAYSVVVKATTMAAFYGNNSLTAALAAATPAVARLAGTGVTDAPTTATTGSGTAVWLYAYAT